MTVSILIPSHRPHMVTEAIASVFAQTDPDYQLIVDFQRAPLGDRLNRMAEAAVGEYIMVLADDDLLTPSFLEATQRSRARGADLIYTNAEVWRVDRSRAHAYMRPYTMDNLRRGPPCWLTSMISTKLWRHVGGHRPGLEYHDWDFWLRVQPLVDSHWEHVHEALWVQREHPGQWSANVRRPGALAALQAAHPGRGIVDQPLDFSRP